MSDDVQMVKVELDQDQVQMIESVASLSGLTNSEVLTCLLAFHHLTKCVPELDSVLEQHMGNPVEEG